MKKFTVKYSKQRVSSRSEEIYDNDLIIPAPLSFRESKPLVIIISFSAIF